MLFADEQIILTDLIDKKLTDNIYTMNNQIADFALFTITDGDIFVRYDGLPNANSGFKLLTGGVYMLENQDQIKGFIASDAQTNSTVDTPTLDITYISLEWPKHRRLEIPRMRQSSIKVVNTNTQEVSLQTGGRVLRRLWTRPQHEFQITQLNIEDEQEDNLYGIYSYLQGDTAAYYYINKYSSIDRPIVVGYGDGVKEELFLPARYIIPNTLKIYFDRTEINSYSINYASGLVSFYSTIPIDVIVSASFARYYKCVFDGEFQDPIAGSKSEINERTFKLREVHP